MGILYAIFLWRIGIPIKYIFCESLRFLIFIIVNLPILILLVRAIVVFFSKYFLSVVYGYNDRNNRIRHKHLYCCVNWTYFTIENFLKTKGFLLAKKSAIFIKTETKRLYFVWWYETSFTWSLLFSWSWNTLPYQPELLKNELPVLLKD